MTDLERLDEAIAEWSHSYESLEPVLAAARAYRELLADGERVEWCEEHNAESVQNHGGMSDECWRVVWVDNGYGNPEEVPYSYDLCRIVSRLLVDPPKEEER